MEGNRYNGSTFNAEDKPSVRAKVQQQAEITSQIEEFLKRGGKIQQCGEGEQTIDYTLKWTDGKGLQYSSEKTRALQQSTVRCNANGDNVVTRKQVIPGKNKKKAGFTLVEAMIVLAIVGIILAVVAPLFFGTPGDRKSKGSWGMNGYVEERCIGGYRVIIGDSGRPEQIIGENGGGVRCQ